MRTLGLYLFAGGGVRGGVIQCSCPRVLSPAPVQVAEEVTGESQGSQRMPALSLDSNSLCASTQRAERTKCVVTASPPARGLSRKPGGGGVPGTPPANWMSSLSGEGPEGPAPHSTDKP